MLGVLGVSLDVRYGEGGAAAFLRLQEQLIQSNQNEMIFAWTSDELESSGMPAPSVECFRDSSDITYDPDHRSRGSAYQLTNRGVEFPAPLWTVGRSQGEDIGWKLRGLKKTVDLALYAWRWNPDKKKVQHVSIRLAGQSTSYRRTNLQFQRIEFGRLGFAKVTTTISGSINGVQSLGATSLINIPQTAVYKPEHERSRPGPEPERELYRAKLGRDG